MLEDSYALNHQVVLIQMVEANIQKQPPRGVLTKRCSEIFSKFTREHTPTSRCDFNEVALHGCSPVHLCIFSEHLWLKETQNSYFCVIHKNHRLMFVS